MIVMIVASSRRRSYAMYDVISQVLEIAQSCTINGLNKVIHFQQRWVEEPIHNGLFLSLFCWLEGAGRFETTCLTHSSSRHYMLAPKPWKCRISGHKVPLEKVQNVIKGILFKDKYFWTQMLQKYQICCWAEYEKFTQKVIIQNGQKTSKPSINSSVFAIKLQCTWQHC